MIEYKLLKDEDLVKSIQNNQNPDACLNILIDRHSGLCVDMINSYMSKTYNESLRRELINEKDFQIYNSALKYDPQKGSKFSTYLGNEIKWRCLNIYNKNKKRKTIQVEEDLINHFNFLNTKQVDDKMEIFEDIISHAQTHPDYRVGKIFNLRYVVGKNNSVMPWKLISKDLGMSIQGCINIHDSALNFFKNKIRKEIYE